MIEFNNFKDILNSYNNVIISAHTNPDGDAISSCIALALGLKKIDKNVIVILEDYGERYDFLEKEDFIFHNLTDLNNFKNELFISLDCGDKLRLGEFFQLFNNAKVTINIDHHISNNNFADYNYVFEKSSTSEIIYELLNELNIDIDNSIAKAMYTGILYDTGGFKHSNATSRTYEVVSELIKYDFVPSEIYSKLFNTFSYEATKLLGVAINKIEMFFDNKVACSYITLNDMKQFNTDKSQLGGIIDNLKNIKDVEVAVFIYEKEYNQCKVSMRCDGEIDICKIAMEFGGGGHYKACGCTINAKIEDVKTLIIEKIKNCMI